MDDVVRRLRVFLTMEDHPGDVALLDAIEEAANEIERLDMERDKTIEECADRAKTRIDTIELTGAIATEFSLGNEVAASIRALARKG